VEAEPHPVVSARRRGVDLPEHLEDHGQLLVRNADPGVADLDRHLAVLGMGDQFDRPVIGELDRVADQILDDGLHLDAIDHDEPGA
jgi:hypothetical protein